MDSFGMSDQVIKLGRKAEEDRGEELEGKGEVCRNWTSSDRDGMLGKEVSNKEVAAGDWELKTDEPTWEIQMNSC